MGTHDLARQGQADAGTLGTGSEERIEYMLRVSIGNGPAVVGDMNLGIVGCIDKRRDSDKRRVTGGGAVPEAVAQGIDGILEDVGEHLPEPRHPA